MESNAVPTEAAKNNDAGKGSSSGEGIDGIIGFAKGFISGKPSVLFASIINGVSPIPSPSLSVPL